MTEREYFDRVETARRYISGGQLEAADRLLTALYEFKPTRLLWFVAKAEYILRKRGDARAALESLEGKYFLGEDSIGLRECMKFRISACRELGLKDDAAREDYLYRRVRGKSCSRQEQELAETLEAVASDTEDGTALQALAGAQYRTADTAGYFIVYQELLRRGLAEEASPRRVRTLHNYGYLEEKIAAENANTFILVMDEYLDRSLEILGHLLSCFGHQVFLLSPPLVFETEGRVDLKETVPVSMEQAGRYPDMCVIPPVALAEDGEIYGDNRDYIIDHLCREESERDNAVILCSGYLLEDLYAREGLRGRMSRLSAYESDIQEEKLHFGWAGSYLSYISDLYGYDVQTDIQREPEVDFSIVIPARNSSATLRYTLQTCLRQRYEGSYEVVVSDNSVDGNTEIYELCQELDDPHIRYVRTPRSLQLARSFEFGYLQTRGAFVLSIGSDDGLLPWGLESIKAVLAQHPEDEILVWERGFYAWPGFNGGQQNQFIIPRKYAKGQIGTQYLSGKDLLNYLAREQQMIYTLPMLYINSGFRRSYLKTLLRKTGKLWDGASQDLPMAIINCCIHQRVLYMVYPIAIAGMSGASIGYLNSCPNSTAKDSKEYKIARHTFHQDNIGLYTPGRLERRMHLCGLDVSGLYCVLSRAVEEGLLSEKRMDQVLDWRSAAKRIAETFSMLEDTYDIMLQKNLFSAKKLSDSHYAFFKALSDMAVCPRRFDTAAMERQRAQKSYSEGRNPSGGETLDASRFDVSNVLQAVELFAKRTGL